MKRPFVLRKQLCLRVLSFDESNDELIEVETRIQRLTAQNGAIGNVDLCGRTQFAPAT